MDIVDYKRAEQLAHNMLSTVASLRHQLGEAFRDKVIDREYYAHMTASIQSLDFSIRGFQRAQEWAYRLSGGAFYQRPWDSGGVLRNKP